MVRKLSNKFKLGLFLFFSVFFASTVWSFILPIGDFGPDETAHLQMIKFLAEEKRIPVFDSENGLQNLVFEKQLWNEKFRTGAYYSMAYNSPLSYLPFLPAYLIERDIESRGSVLAMRLTNSFIAAAFALVLFLFFIKIDRGNLAISSTLAFFVVFMPQLIFSSSYVNIELIPLLLAGISTLILLSIREKPTVNNFLFLGTILGLLVLCKANYLSLAGLVLVFASLIIFRKEKQRVLSFFSLVFPIALLNIYWWYRNIILYKDPLIINHIQNKISSSRPDWFLPPGEAGYNALTIVFQPDFFRNTFLGFFAAIGKLDIFLSGPFYAVFYLFLAFLIIAAVNQSAKKFRENKGGDDLKINLIIIFFIVFIFFIFAKKNLLDFSPQGRHLFPALLPITWLLYNGIRSLSEKSRRFVEIFMMFFALLSSLSVLWLMIDKYWGGHLDLTPTRMILITLSVIFISLYLAETSLIIRGKNGQQLSD
jgi:hypothetical protein